MKHILALIKIFATSKVAVSLMFTNECNLRLPYVRSSARIYWNLFYHSKIPLNWLGHCFVKSPCHPLSEEGDSIRCRSKIQFHKIFEVWPVSWLEISRIVVGIWYQQLSTAARSTFTEKSAMWRNFKLPLFSFQFKVQSSKRDNSVPLLMSCFEKCTLNSFLLVLRWNVKEYPWWWGFIYTGTCQHKDLLSELKIAIARLGTWVRSAGEVSVLCMFCSAWSLSVL